MQTLPTLIETGHSLTRLEKQQLKEIVNVANSTFIDLSQTTKVDAYALAKILFTYEKLSMKGKTLALINPSASVRTLLYVTKLHNIIPSFANLRMANQHISNIEKNIYTDIATQG
jgi:ABC-type transporter Mla MlaB component